VQVNTICYHPDNTDWIYVGTDLGVLASEDKGLTWNLYPGFGENDGPVNVEVDDLFWQGDEYLIAATHGRGMFRARPLAVLYVDLHWVGPEDGSLGNPFNTIQEAIDAAGSGAVISVKGGTYSESPILFTKRGTIEIRNGAVVVE
jgi:hypothetical protein